MTFGDVDHMNDRALDSLDQMEPSDDRAPDSSDEPVRYRVTDQEALQNANQHELQRDYKW